MPDEQWPEGGERDAEPTFGVAGRLLRRYARFIVAHPRPVLLVLAVACTLVTLQARHLQIQMRAEDVFPQGHPHTQLFRAIRGIFGLEKTAVVAIKARDGDVFRPATLEKIETVTRAVERIRGVVPGTIISLASPRCKRIDWVDGAVDVRPFMETVPRTPAAVADLRAAVLGSEPYRGLIVAADGSAAAVTVGFEDSIPNMELLHQLEMVAEGVRDDETEVILTGGSIIAAYLERYTTRIALIFPITLVIVALIHYEAFRTIQAMVLPLVTAVVSLLLCFGIMGMLGFPMDPWNAPTPIIILAVAAGHAVQMLKRYYEEFARTGSNQQAIVNAMTSVGPVMLAAGGIAAAGFGSLATFNVPSVRIFGVIVSCGIVAALVIELTLIPASRALLPAPRALERQREAKDSLVSKAARPLFRQVMRAPGRVVVVATLLVLAVALGIARIGINNSYRQWFSPSSKARVDEAFVNQTFAGSATIHLLLTAGEPKALEQPAVVRAVDELEEVLRRYPEIGKVISYVDLLREMHRALATDGAASLPETRQQVAQYLLLHEMNLGPEGLGSLLDAGHDHALIVVLSRSDEAQFGRAVVDHLRAYAAERFRGLPARLDVAAGEIGLEVAANEEVVREKIRNVLQVSAVIFALSSLAFRSFLGGLFVLAPLILAAMVSLGFMGWLGIWLGMTTAAVTAMGFSIGADFAIYLLQRIREEGSRGRQLEAAVAEALATAGLAVCFVSSAIVVGYLSLTLTGFYTWMQVGSLTAVMIATAALTTLTVLPALALLIRPRFLLTGPGLESAADERVRTGSRLGRRPPAVG